MSRLFQGGLVAEYGKISGLQNCSIELNYSMLFDKGVEK
jgi:hypothetical protein